MSHLGAGRLPQGVAVQAATEVANRYGERVQTWATVLGLENVPAVVVPSSQVKQRGEEFVRTEESHTLLLGGYFSMLTTKMRLLAEDGSLYEVLGVEHDPWRTWTQVRVREVL